MYSTPRPSAGPVAGPAQTCRRIQVVVGQPTGMDCADDHGGATDDRAAHHHPEDTTVPLPLDVLVVRLGVPRLGPIADWGLAMERKQLVVDTATFRHQRARHLRGGRHQYPGKRKLIVCGFHEGRCARAFALQRKR